MKYYIIFVNIFSKNRFKKIKIDFDSLIVTVFKVKEIVFTNFIIIMIN